MKKYSEKEWKYELDLNVRINKRLWLWLHN